MKKLVSIIVIIMMVISAFAMAEDAERIYFDNRDYVWFDSVINEFNQALENGEMINGSNMYLYDGIIYSTDSGMDITWIDIGHEIILRTGLDEVERYLEALLKEDGAQFPMVRINFVGQNEYEEDIYEITIMMMENMNEFSGKNAGDGFLKEGIEYYGMKVLGPIFQ